MAGLPCGGQEMLEFAGNMLDRHGVVDASSAPALLEVKIMININKFI